MLLVFSPCLGLRNCPRGDLQALERRMMQWEDLRSEFMRVAAGELMHDPFRVGNGEEKWRADKLRE